MCVIKEMGTTSSSIGRSGFRVITVQNGSPGHKCGLVPYFDLIIQVNNTVFTSFEDADDIFQELIITNKGKPMKLKVFNLKNESSRDLIVTPCEWHKESSSLLGIATQFDGCSEDMGFVRVLEVEPGSPAQIAGLNPFNDYFLGTNEMFFSDTEDLFNVIESHEGMSLELYIYNIDDDKIRIVNITPSRSWNGTDGGLLGCNIGQGYVHAIPQRSRQTLGITLTVEPYIVKNTSTYQTCSTPYGNGTILKYRSDGIYIVQLDWKLANSSVAIAYLQKDTVIIKEK